jgi:hypothetical protein
VTSKKAEQAAQSQRFINAAREAGCSEYEAEIRENMKRIAKAGSSRIQKPATK